ncbi:MAG: TonB-dependent receptor [Tenacibaculum sp.]|nr:TonB-dependent receptor [Tenacibaculum sp.]
MKKSIILMLFISVFLMGGVNVYSQQNYLIKGSVKTPKGQYLDAVSVIVENTKKGTVTDDNGNYSLKLPTGEYTLVFSYLGYSTKKEKVVLNKNVTLNTILVESDEQLDEITVTGFENNRSILETAGSISKIRSLEINRDNNIDIAQSLNNIPGVHVDATGGGSTRLSIRGSMYRYIHTTMGVKVYWNDLPVTSADGGTATDIFNPNIINSVEVIKGSSGNVYGSGTGGVILFKTELPEYGDNSISAGTLFGKYGLFRNKFGANISTENSRINISYTTQEYDGYRKHTETSLNTLAVTGLFNTGKKGKLSVFAVKNEKNVNRGGYLSEKAFKEDPFGVIKDRVLADYGIDTKNLLFGASYKYEMLKNLSATFGGTVSTRSFNHPNRDNGKNKKKPATDKNTYGAIIFSKDIGYTFRGKIEYKPQIFENVKTKFTVGLETLHNDIDKSTYETTNTIVDFNKIKKSDNTKSNNSFYFGQIELDFPNDFYFTIGGSYNVQDYDIKELYKVNGNDFSSKFDVKSVFSPRVSLTKKFNDNISVHASINKGFSPPRSAEINPSTGDINTKLLPEDGISYEIGARGKVAKNKLFYDVTLYRMNTDNIILGKKDANDKQVYFNGGNVRQQGIEATLNYNVVEDSEKIKLLRLWTTYTYQDYTIVKNEAKPQYDGKRMAGISPHSLNLGVDLQTNFGLYGNTVFNYRDERFAEDANKVVVDSHSLLSAKIGYKKLFFNHLEFDVFVGGKNLFDTIWVDYLDVNAYGSYFNLGEPRAFYGGLNVKYIF